MRAIPWVCRWVVATQCVLLGCGVVGCTGGEVDDAATHIDSVIDAAIADGLLAGAAVVVLRGDDTVHAKGYGWTDLETRTPVGVESLFNIASVTKLFTGAALVSLHEGGALDLDDSLQEWVPEFPNPGQGSRITLRQLVNHTSGLNDYVAADLARWEATGEPLTTDFVLDYLRDRPLDFEPGSHWSYTNSGFYLAGIVIERASGVSWADYVADSVVAPLGLENVRLCDDVAETVAVGYELGEAGLTPAPLYLEAGLRGDGGLCASALDLAQFPGLLEAGDFLSSGGLASMRSATRLTTGVDVDYGLGTRLGRLQGRPVWGHTGGHAGTVAVVSRYPTEDATIAVLTNTIRTGSDALVLLGEVAAKVLDLDTAPPRGSATSDATLLPYVGVYRGGRDGTRYEVSVEDGRLQISPSGSETGASFTYLGDHTFAMVDGGYPLDRYVFYLRDGGARAYSGYYNGMHGAFRQRVGP